MKSKNIAILLVRFALAAGFLSAVADRFGLWGLPGESNVAWGDFSSFLDYTATLNPWVPKSLLPFVGWIATILETIFALALIVGFRIKEAALGSALLLLTFTLAMVCTLGIKAPLDYSVFGVSAAAFLLYVNQKEIKDNA